MAPALRAGNGTRQLDAMASEPRLWLGLRRLDAIGLLLCALWISGGTAQAFVLPNATDPVASGQELVWQNLGGHGVLRTPSGRHFVLPGQDPAVGGTLVAWRNGDRISISSARTLAPILVITAPGANALAVSNGWLVFRHSSHDGAEESLTVVNLRSHSQRKRRVAGPRPVGEIGRPALDGGTLIFTVDTPLQSKIVTVGLAHGGPHLLRRSRGGAALFNPSALNGYILYERVNPCAQYLMLGRLHHPGRDRVLLKLPSTVGRDPGYQAGYEHAWNGASLCHNRRAGSGGSRTLGPTALGSGRAYVSESSPRAHARIFTIRRGSGQ
jgi:hypothetical protein